MGFDICITESLIQAVKKNPMLYDINLPEYKNFQKKKAVWQAIAAEIGGKNGNTMCWKWKQLRDSYAKHRKNMNAIGDDGSRNKYMHWRWAPYMTFLDDHFRKPKNLLATDPDYAEDNNESISYIELPMDVNTNSTDMSVSQRTETNRKRKYVESNNSIIEPFQESSNERLDIVDYLFLNYAETFKKLSPRRQAMLKLQMAKIFAEAELEEMEKDPIKCES